jgi:hypothetical protein
MKNFTVSFIVFSFGLIFGSCSEDSQKPNIGWTKVISTNDFYTRQIAANNDNLLFVGSGKDGLKFISVDKTNRIVEQRNIEFTRTILTPDFYATVGNYGGGLSGKDSTVIKFYSTKVSMIDPIGIIDSRKLRSVSVPSNFTLSSIQITSTHLSDDSYGVLLAYGPSAATNIDVAKIRIQSNKVEIVNKSTIGTFLAEQIPYVGDMQYPFVGDNNHMFAFKDNFIIKFPSAIYSYASDGSISTIPNLPANYSLDDVSFNRNDTLFNRGWDYTLQYITARNLNGNWKLITNSERVRTFSDNYFINENSYPFNIYKLDKSQNKIELVNSDGLVGIVSPIQNSLFINFNNEAYVINGNLIYSKPLKELLQNRPTQ